MDLRRDGLLAALWMGDVKIGACGSPLETDAGWRVLTHGIGPVRCYSHGALLLDLDDPSGLPMSETIRVNVVYFDELLDGMS